MATTNFDFTTLSGSETAGYTSINTLINSIDTMLKQRVFAADKTWASIDGDGNDPTANEVMIFTGSWGTDGYWKAGLVAAANIASDAITADKIISNAVTTIKINAGAVTTAKLADDSVTAAKLADDSVTTANILDGQVTAAKLDAGLTTQILPAGMVSPFAGTTAPSGWLLCNGAAVSRTTYNGLFSIIGTTYGAGDTSTTFNLPDMNGRVPVGKSADTEFDALNEKGGSKSVTLTSAESGVPAHGHTNTVTSNGTGISVVATGDHSHSAAGSTSILGYILRKNGAASAGDWNGFSPGVGTAVTYGTSVSVYNGGAHGHSISDPTHAHTVTVNNNTAANAASAHTNLQPYITLNYIIKF
jgi:microcystin-dependent protein